MNANRRELRRERKIYREFLIGERQRFMTGRAMRPRSADSFRKIYSRGTKVAKGRGVRKRNVE